MKCIVLLSGGQDSTTALLWAIKNKFEVSVALTIAYGQRHEVEIECAEKIASMGEIDHHVVAVGIGTESALTGNAKLAPDGGWMGYPTSFVPARNLVMLTTAAQVAFEAGVHFIVTGYNEVDYSGYPDCRREFVDSFERTWGLATEYPLRVVTPFIKSSKKDIWQWAFNAGEDPLIVEHTHTCYRGDREQRHPWGYGCGECEACRIRKEGFDAALHDS